MSWVEGPAAVPAANRDNLRAPASARSERLRIARTDFFLDDSGRLTDEERALMGAALRQLVADVADELLSFLPAVVAARADSSRTIIYGRLRRAGLLDRNGIVALLLRRADEQRLGGHRENAVGDVVGSMAGDADPTIADSAMALTIARGRRRDRYGRIGIEFDDLDAEDAVALVYSVAAVLVATGTAESESVLLDAARQLLSRHDEGLRLEAVVASLAHALVSADRDDEALISRLAEDRDAFLLVALMAQRAGIDLNDAWTMFVQGDAMVLARLSSCSRNAAARMIAAFDKHLDQVADRAIEQYDALDEAEVGRIRRSMRTDSHYRDAMERLGVTHG